MILYNEPGRRSPARGAIGAAAGAPRSCFSTNTSNDISKLSFQNIYNN